MKTINTSVRVHRNRNENRRRTRSPTRCAKFIWVKIITTAFVYARTIRIAFCAILSRDDHAWTARRCSTMMASIRHTKGSDDGIKLTSRCWKQARLIAFESGRVQFFFLTVERQLKFGPNLTRAFIGLSEGGIYSVSPWDKGASLKKKLFLRYHFHRPC